MCLVIFSSVSSAEEVDYESQIKLFESAAVALHQYHPRVSSELAQYASDQASWRDETKVDKNEAEDEKAEMLTKEKKKAHIKLLRDAAALLQHSNPELSKALIGLADRKSKKMSETLPRPA